VLRSGAVLRMPDAAQVSAVSPSEATSEIRRQYTAWRGEAAPPAAAAAAEPGRLKLVTPSEGASTGTAPAAPNGQTAALQNRVKDLEGQVAEQKRLMDLKDADLARLQAQLAAKQAPAQQAPAQATPPAPPPPAATPAPAEQPPAQAAPPPAAEEKAPAPAPEAVPPAPKPAPTPVAKTPAPSGGGSILDYWWVALLALLALVGFGASRVLRARRASAFDDSLGRLAVAGADAAEAEREPIVPSRGFASGDVPVRPTPAAAAEPAFLVEETGTHERPRFTPGGAPAPAAKHVASDETISSETAINLDQGDPLAEADFHMAYGLYDQAADLIRIAISREPARRDLKLKLLEVFFVWGNKEQFLQTARELAESRADAAPGEWEKILIMGKQLAPEDPLFSGSGAVSGAAAAGVDLDLEGGQSRVDFDLLGEPVPAEGGQGVDLDLGSALGDRDPTTESPTNVTDRNVALADNTFSSSSGSTATFAGGNTGTFAGATTGTTRQMTQRMRPDSTGSTAEMEGPTVEQPQLRSNDNPTIRQKLETALKQGAGDQTAELAIDDLGLDVGQVDTVDQPGIASASASTPDAPTLVAGMDDRSRRVMEDARQRAVKEETGSTTGAWQFDQDEIEAALTSTSLQMPDVSATSRLAALSKHDVDVDLGDATGTHQSVSHSGSVDLDVGEATGTHPSNGGLDLDVGTATVPDAAFAATQRLASEDLALPDLEPVTMSEVGTKLDLARAYMDMGDPDGARNILEEVLNEGSAAQKQEAQRLMESLPG
ncbi:MAG TPA: FimV/HubP family polar landmark protein, partial [Steroidobacteraceae bacterium]|nr:FimV/HubP family polar landmark protein [Steroidobacteraceae bacterium]